MVKAVGILGGSFDRPGDGGLQGLAQHRAAGFADSRQFAEGPRFRTVLPEVEGVDPYERMTALAAESPVGAKNLLFNPSLAGGSSLEPSPHLRGAFVGLDLGHTQADVIRAALEGIALNLRVALDELPRSF